MNDSKRRGRIVTTMNQCKREQNQKVLRDLLVKHYIAAHEGMTVKQLVEALGRNESWVRRYLHDDRYGGLMLDGVTYREEWRTTYSRDYPGMESGACKVRVYEPTKDFLARMVKALTDKLAQRGDAD